jgi:hypothetical protein
MWLMRRLEFSCETESQPKLIEKYERRISGGISFEIVNFDFGRSRNF